jgi:protein required for attachment to host cells
VRSLRESPQAARGSLKEYPMTETWVVSANDRRARILRSDSRTGPLTEIADLVHPIARMKESEFVTDRPGRSFDSLGKGRHAMSSQVDAKRQEEIRFAKEVIDRLEQGRTSGAFERLAVVASPAFLGHLRDTMSAALRTKVVLELDKDYTALPADELRAHLPERL